MNIFNDNFNSNNSLCLTFSGKGLNDTSNILNNYLKSGIGFQLLSNNSNYKEFVIADTSNINSNYFASLRIAIEKSQISLKSITSNNIIQPLIINSNIYISCNIAVGVNNSLYDIEAKSNINANDYFIKGVSLSNIFTTSNVVQTSIQNLSNLTNGWTKSTSTIIYTNSNVGINKSNPTYNLDVIGDINYTGNLRQNGIIFKYFSGSFSDLANKPDVIWYLNGNNASNFNSGNIGINSSIPTSKLDVGGDINFTGRLLKNKIEYKINWNSIEGVPEFARVAYTGEYSNLNNSPSSGTLTGIKVNWEDIQKKPDFVKIATSGSWNDINDKPNLFDSNYSSLRNPPLIPFILKSGSSDIYNINTGNVGIKQSSPTSALDVGGDINFTGNLKKNGNIYGGDWYTLANRPILQEIATSALFRDLYGKPDYYPADWKTTLANIPTIFDGDYNKLSNTPSYFKTKWSMIEGKEVLANVAYSGKYSDLIKDTSLPVLHPIALSGKWSDLEKTDKPNISAVGLSGNYYDLSNLPILFSSNWNDIINKPMLFDSNFNSLINRPYVAFIYNEITKNMSTTNDGNVGIGVANPTNYKLDVNGNINATGNININGIGYNLTRNGVAITNTTATFSDYRIKNNIKDVNDLSCLDQFMKLKTKNFNYIDTFDFGSKNTIGFIAQEVNDIIPDAVRITEEYIPNIYKNYSLISSNSILIDDDNINKISIEDFIKLRINNQTFLTKVIDKKDNIIITEDIIDNNSNCFLYGTKVNDFHILDKTFLYTLNISATQELYKKVEEQKKEIDELKLAVAKLIR